jgi:hypothetical protein
MFPIDIVATVGQQDHRWSAMWSSRRATAPKRAYQRCLMNFDTGIARPADQQTTWPTPMRRRRA